MSKLKASLLLISILSLLIVTLSFSWLLYNQTLTQYETVLEDELTN